MIISPFNIYLTENNLDKYCLPLFQEHTRDSRLVWYDTFTPTYHIASYCLRLTDEDYKMVISDLKNITALGFTFSELKEKDITSQMLLAWSSDFDLAEPYEMFLFNSSSNWSNQTFYNCTSLWFGPFCRFRFDYRASQSFHDVVHYSFQRKRQLDRELKVTCYIHLSCQTFLSCLDWREICDGKIHCLDGSDETHCWQLEMNQCNNEEYTCHNGQCIPMEFLHDMPDHSDCLDQTDEPLFNDYQDCYLNPSSTCDEQMCGDGQCTDGFELCSNGRSSISTHDHCSNAVWCLSGYLLVNGWFCLRCKRDLCIKKNCSSIFELRSIPPIYGHIHLTFPNTIESFSNQLIPIYVCYDKQLCEDVPSATENVGNRTCHSEYEATNVAERIGPRG